MSGYCGECGELMDNYAIGHYAFGCYCVVLAIRKKDAEAKNAADDRVIELLEAIGGRGECKDCGADVFFVLHHKDRGVVQTASSTYGNKWRRWMKFEPDGTRHVHEKAKVSKKASAVIDYDR